MNERQGEKPPNFAMPILEALTYAIWMLRGLISLKPIFAERICVAWI